LRGNSDVLDLEGRGLERAKPDDDVMFFHEDPVHPVDARLDGLILGYLMYRSGLMPRGLAMVGLVGGSLICISGFGVVLDVFARGGTAQAIATIPEFFWELSLGIYPIVKGFKASPILEARLPTSRVDEVL
jgi:Domain of unknown function (DUF4386)